MAKLCSVGLGGWATKALTTTFLPIQVKFLNRQAMDMMDMMDMMDIFVQILVASNYWPNGDQLGWVVRQW